MSRRTEWAILVVVLLLATQLLAQQLYQERYYEPVVIKQREMPIWEDLPLDQVYLYAYDAWTGTWRLMPFQIDEVYNTWDPCKPGVEAARRDFYVHVGSANVIAADANPAFDSDDELVFLVGDMGDRAPDDVWLDDPDARRHRRFEIAVADPNDPSWRAYAYLYQSSTLQAEVPSPYGFAFDPALQQVETFMYRLRLNPNSGVVEDVAIKPPYGTGVDFFDTQKIRFVGYLDYAGSWQITIGMGGAPAANERDNLHLYQPHEVGRHYFGYTARPVVRLVRTVRQVVKFGLIRLDEAAFYVKGYFYPYSARLVGGVNLDTEKLKEVFHTEDDIYIELELLRQSWDFNSNAAGMRFYNRFNDGVLIDGQPDAVNSAIRLPIREWGLVTGPQGSMFTHGTFRDTTWQSIALYYHDSQQGGVADGTSGGDTGDGVSYGDYGIVFRGSGQDSVDLELGFVAYFLPANLPRSEAEKLAFIIEHPVHVSARAMSYPSDVAWEQEGMPARFQLLPVFPNPGAEGVMLRFALDRQGPVTLTVVDVRGRTVRTVAAGDLPPGMHQAWWDGLDAYGNRVPPGVYTCWLRTERLASSRKVLIVR
ncbi:MAG: hypothetical protein ONB25_06705 [candidate division KSB1 bacterium]|nr:hypothetical protein [candidate division KSB1 bacterium]